MLYINEEIVASLLKWNDIFAALEAAFTSVANGRVFQNPRTITNVLSTNNSLLTMPGYVENDKFGALACKLVTAFPSNTKLEKPLDVINAHIALFDKQTGFLTAIIAATEITKWRTAAASMVATKSLLHSDNKDVPLRIAILGCGAQGQIHADSFPHFFNCKEIRLWNRTTLKAEQLAQKCNEKQKTNLYKVYTNIQQCVHDADVIVTATFSTTSLLKLGWIKKGAHINAVGAAINVNHHSELDEEIYRASDVYIDHWAGAKSELSGLEKIGVRFKGEIGAVLTGKLTRDEDVQKITVFQSLGMAAEDCTVARIVYDLYIKNIQ